jgi:hypothetical protein
MPAKAASANLLVATWNLRAFGDLTTWETGENISAKRNFAAIQAIAAVIRRFDVVAVQDVRGNLRALRYAVTLMSDGASWRGGTLFRAAVRPWRRGRRRQATGLLCQRVETSNTSLDGTGALSVADAYVPRSVATLKSREGCTPVDKPVALLIDPRP